jgi:hypothetical protein
MDDFSYLSKALDDVMESKLDSYVKEIKIDE